MFQNEYRVVLNNKAPAGLDACMPTLWPWKPDLKFVIFPYGCVSGMWQIRIPTR